MKLQKDKVVRWVRILATVCRYAGVVVLTFTLTSLMAIHDEFGTQVEDPLHSIAGPNWTDDISTVAEGTRSAMRHMSSELVVAALNEWSEEDNELRDWRTELRIVNAYARRLEESVMRGLVIKPLGATGSSDSGHENGGDPYYSGGPYSPFDPFYGTAPGFGSSDAVEEKAEGKSREDLSNEALRAWNVAMKERGYAVLPIPSNAALYPYKGLVVSFLWTGIGILSVGVAPFLITTIRERRKFNAHR
ncbi:hypothetical protein OVA24_06780 [Luteolibacter sp. SL250]|uniref:hypothetical protein n=1 Tax=Luteolibacter sp. SL250 TaxID=2995170 RepID=UPI00226E17BD|nr:hypothetical protein [Luteolibacter sp. SL250]WAC21086.1 hypothetical protein OVA24_06780 [Luteolibacter sp. SL250]